MIEIKNTIIGILLVGTFTVFGCKSTQKTVEQPSAGGDKAVVGLAKVDQEKYAAIEQGTYTIKSLTQEGALLVVEVSYTGVSAKTNFNLYWNGSVKKSLPVRAAFKLEMVSNGQEEVLTNEKRYFSLDPLKAYGKSAYITIEGFDQKLLFRFSE